MSGNRQRIAYPLILALFAYLFAACASAPRANYSSNANAKEELAKLDTEIDQAVNAQYDVVTPKEIRRAQKHLNEAREEFAENDWEDFWEEMSLSRGYLNRAHNLFNERSAKIQDVLNARKAAVNAGARRYDETSGELHELDESFKKNASLLDKKRDNRGVWDRALIDYGALQVRTVREAYVGEARDLIDTAKRRGARTFAPRTLRQANRALDDAEKAIASDPGNEDSFMPAVNRANDSARVLVAVNATARRASGQSNEQVAREIVGRNMVISSLANELEGADAEAAMTTEALRQKTESMKGMEESNLALRSEAEWNKAIQDVRSRFSEEEADVYREGDKLLIRLKSLNFPVGKAEVPRASRQLLGKVSNVIEELNAKKVEVQGHTDSTGTPEINKKLSQERAENVADVIEDKVEEVDVKAVGYGFDKPVAPDRDKKRRAMNRRVDLLITPERGAAAEGETPQAM